MKRSPWISGFVLAGAIGLAGCGGGPTAPPQGGPGQPATLDLSGTWTGTVMDRAGSCSPEAFTVALTQAEESTRVHETGSEVSGSFLTACQGSFVIQGFLSKGRLYGNITGKGRISGTASAGQIEFSVIEGGGGLEGDQRTVAQVAMQK